MREDRIKLHGKQVIWRRSPRGLAIVIMPDKKQTGRALIKDINQKYGSLDGLQKYIKENPEDIIACLDFEDAKYLEKHPEKLDEQIETGNIWITWDPERLNLLDCIKTHKSEL